jgi:hypothetical protein
MIEIATLKNYDAATHRAAVQLAGSLTTYLDDIPVSVAIPPSDLVVGNYVILAMPGDNPRDACVIATWPQGTPGGGVGTFLDLSDTPSNYSGQSGKTAAVNGSEDGLEFEGEAHRTWNWADEATWYKTPFLPLACTGRWTKHGSSLICEAGWAIGDPCPIYDPGFGDYPWRMYTVKIRQESGVWCYYFHRYKSTDGIAWTDEGVMKYDSTDFTAANLSVTQIRSPSVIKDIDESNSAKRWKMWFNEMAGTGPTYSTWYCYSCDGFNWSTPVQAIAAGTYYYGCPVVRAGDMFIMLLPNSSWQIVLLVGEDETTWHSHGVVIDKGAGGSWDDGLVRDPTLVYISGVFYGLYSGRNAAGTAEQIGIAFGLPTSTTKLLTFSKFVNNPVIPVDGAGSFDAVQAGQPRVIMVNRKFYCYYTAAGSSGNNGISRATIP